METLKGQIADWGDNDFVAATQTPGVSVTAMSPELPSVTVATIIGVTMLVLLTIAGVFLLGVLFDCRQQRILDEKMDEVKRLRIQRRPKPQIGDDEEGIAEGMEETAQSVAPAEILRTIP